MNKKLCWTLLPVAVITVVFATFSFVYIWRLDSEISDLSKKAELLSNYNIKSKSNIEIVSNEVAKLKENKDFIKDAYSNNIGWASLVLSIMVAGVFGLTVYNVVDNSGKVKELKEEFKKQTDDALSELSDKYDTHIISIKRELSENKAQVLRMAAYTSENNGFPSQSVYRMIEVLELDIEFVDTLNRENKVLINDIYVCKYFITVSKQFQQDDYEHMKDRLNDKIKNLIELYTKKESYDSDICRLLNGIQTELSE